jgi:GNAT superfamily N-acetyltransferase
MTRSSPTSADAVDVDGPVEITKRLYQHPDAMRLVRALYDEQLARYGFADPVEADATMYAPPRGLFLVVYVAGIPSACGGYRRHDPEGAVVEIKKAYTVPELRARGLGGLLLSRLEENAARAGARTAILETGARSHPALALVRRSGYRPAPQYVSGRDPAINRAFVKDLSGSTASTDQSGPRATA